MPPRHSEVTGADVPLPYPHAGGSYGHCVVKTYSSPRQPVAVEPTRVGTYIVPVRPTIKNKRKKKKTHKLSQFSQSGLAHLLRGLDPPQTAP
jgi:hypothetical protein